jgi:hypothetical protein
VIVVYGLVIGLDGVRVRVRESVEYLLYDSGVWLSFSQNSLPIEGIYSYTLALQTTGYPLDFCGVKVRHIIG